MRQNVMTTAGGGSPIPVFGMQTFSTVSESLPFNGSGDLLFRLAVQGGFGTSNFGQIISTAALGVGGQA